MGRLGKTIDAVLGLPKSIYFCFKYFPARIAIKLPVLLSRHVYLMNADGEIKLDTTDVTFGLIKIGFGEVGIFDSKYSRTIWQNNGGVKLFLKERLILDMGPEYQSIQMGA